MHARDRDFASYARVANWHEEHLVFLAQQYRQSGTSVRILSGPEARGVCSKDVHTHNCMHVYFEYCSEPQ